MGNQLICTICQETSAEFACTCSASLTQLCASCLVIHLRDKSRIHTSIDLNSIDKISHSENYHIFSQNILEIDHSLNTYRNDLLLFIHNINAVHSKASRLLDEEYSTIIAFCNKVMRNVNDNLKKIADYLNNPGEQADVFIDGFKRNGLNGVLDYYPRELTVWDQPLYDAVQKVFRIEEIAEERKNLEQIFKEKENLNRKIYQMEEVIENLKKEIQQNDFEILKGKKEYQREKKNVETLMREKDSFNAILQENIQLKLELTNLNTLSQELIQNQEIIIQKDKLISEKDELIHKLQFKISSNRSKTRPVLKLALGDIDSLTNNLDSRADTNTSFRSLDNEKLYTTGINEEGWTSTELYEKGNISESIFNVFSWISNTYRMKQCPKCKQEHKILLWKSRYLVCDCLSVIYCDLCGDKNSCECGRYDEMTKIILQANMPYKIEHTSDKRA